MRTLPQKDRPLDGLLVVDLSQFLSGPYCTLKLADLGARVIKVERPEVGDLCRHLYLSDTEIDGDNSLFHAINRNKESITADLRSEEDKEMLFELLRRADVMVQNFRPGVIERLGFGYDKVSEVNPRIVYASITGYGDEGPWRDLPGQDLLAQSRSGLLWLTGSYDDPPTPMGLAVADMLTGGVLAQGILAALVRRGMDGKGSKVETSLLEALVDFQFEVITTYMNDGQKQPVRSAFNGAHAYLGAPYGIYRTSDGYLAIAMTPSLPKLAGLLGVELPEHMVEDTNGPMRNRDQIKEIFAAAIAEKSTAAWQEVLQPEDIWCSEVLDWPALLSSETWRLLDLEQAIKRNDDVSLRALRNPLRINGQSLKSERAAPTLGEHQDKVAADLLTDQPEVGDHGGRQEPENKP